MKQKQTNAILKANGGLHSRRALKKVEDRLHNHGMKRPILVQFVLTGIQTIKEYQSAIKAIAGAIRYYGNELEYFGCYENDEQKGYHAHLYLLIETAKKFPWTVLDVRDGKWLDKFAKKRGMNRIHIAQPQNPIHHGEDGRPEFFARPLPGPKLDDCLQRVSYLYKNRSKDGVDARETYFNSEFRANAVKRAAKKRKPTSAADEITIKEFRNEEDTTTQPEASSIGSTADQEGTSSTSGEAMVCTGQCAGASKEASRRQEANTGADDQQDSSSRVGPNYEGIKNPTRPIGIDLNDSRRDYSASGESDIQIPVKLLKNRFIAPERHCTMKGMNPELTPAEKYLASLYEQCIDAGMDTDEIRKHLLERGVKRTPGQVIYDLDEVFSFKGYAAIHEPKVVCSRGEFDKLIDRV